jgi:hypothetical protein
MPSAKYATSEADKVKKSAHSNVFFPLFGSEKKASRNRRNE